MGIEIAQSKSNVVMNKRKYALETLEEIGMLDFKPIGTTMDLNVKLRPEQGSLYVILGDINDLWEN